MSVVIVNWNTRDLLVQCLESIKDDASGVLREIIVVDNASRDGSADAVRKSRQGVKLIASDTNLGFAAACNRGVEESSGDFVLLLNPDTVVSEGAIGSLRDFLLEHRDVGIVGPLLTGADGQPQVSSFGMFPSLAEAFVHAAHLWTLLPRSSLSRRFLRLPEAGEQWCYTGHVLGACMLIRRQVWDELHGLDAGYFLFVEETDFCYRAAKAGWRCAFTRSARVVHFGEQSMQEIIGQSGGLYVRSYNRFCRKIGMGPVRRLAINLILIAGITLTGLAALVRRRDIKGAWRTIGAITFGYFRKPVVLEDCARVD